MLVVPAKFQPSVAWVTIKTLIALQNVGFCDDCSFCFWPCSVHLDNVRTGCLGLHKTCRSLFHRRNGVKYIQTVAQVIPKTRSGVRTAFEVGPFWQELWTHFLSYAMYWFSFWSKHKSYSLINNISNASGISWFRFLSRELWSFKQGLFGNPKWNGWNCFAQFCPSSIEIWLEVPLWKL